VLRYGVKIMGRPKEHDEATASDLLAAAERAIQTGGLPGLSLRAVARDAGTTTRAIYSLFGSKERLLAALGARAFELLRDGLEARDATPNPRDDLVEAALMFRRFALEHPVLFSIGIQRTDPTVWPAFQSAAAQAFVVLVHRVARLEEANLLGGRSPREAATQFHALCEGLAALELRGTLTASRPEQFWRRTFHALITGFAERPPA
jgi:AcrR family transcriptional regulator